MSDEKTILTFNVYIDGIVPKGVKGLLRKKGTSLELMTAIGWVGLTKRDAKFRNSLTYRVVEAHDD